jgi:hypothetical protein
MGGDLWRIERTTQLENDDGWLNRAAARGLGKERNEPPAEKVAAARRTNVSSRKII